MPRPRVHATPRSATAIRFPTEMLERLHQAADERDVSVNWLVNRAVADFLPRLLPVDEMVWTRPRGEAADSVPTTPAPEDA